MDKLLQNIRYKIRYQAFWTAWYFIVYLIIMIPLYYILINTSVISVGEGSLVYRVWGVIIFQFAFSMRFKEDFNFFLVLSNTRKEIFQSFIGTAIAFSVFFGAVIVLEKVVVDSLNNALGYHNISDPIHFFSPYALDNLFLQFLFFLMLCLCCSAFGIMMGSLFYRFGKKFTLAFWILFSSVPAVVFPLLLWSDYLESNVSVSLANTGEFLRNFNVTVAAGWLLFLTVLFGAAAYWNIRRLPQK